MQLRPKNNQYIFAISFVNYLNKKHGVPKVMLSHQEMFLNDGISYVAIFPVKKLIFHDKFMLFCMYGLIIDGKYIGVFQMNQIIQILTDWNDSGVQMLNIHIHHLMYNNWRTIELLLDTFSNVPIKIYLHDFYLACLSYNLLTDQKKYCGGNGLGCAACKICKNYRDSKKHEKKVRKFINKRAERILFVSPSKSTKDIFKHFYPEYDEQIIIIPHQIYEGNYNGNLNLLKDTDQINVGFLGWPKYHKGWETWETIVEKAPTDKYRFFVFNSDSEIYENMRKVNVSFSKCQMNAMGEALRDHKIHVAFLWSIWPETYSYTYSEASSANAFIITNKISGNICDSIEKNKNGICLENEEDVIECFKNYGKLSSLINDFRIHTQGGPENLIDNEEIVDIVENEKNFGEVKIKSCLKGIHKITNIPLLLFLNWIYPKMQ